MCVGSGACACCLQRGGSIKPALCTCTSGRKINPVLSTCTCAFRPKVIGKNIRGRPTAWRGYRVELERILWRGREKLLFLLVRIGVGCFSPHRAIGHVVFFFARDRAGLNFCLDVIGQVLFLTERDRAGLMVVTNQYNLF